MTLLKKDILTKRYKVSLNDNSNQNVTSPVINAPEETIITNPFDLLKIANKGRINISQFRKESTSSSKRKYVYENSKWQKNKNFTYNNKFINKKFKFKPKLKKKEIKDKLTFPQIKKILKNLETNVKILKKNFSEVKTLKKQLKKSLPKKNINRKYAGGNRIKFSKNRNLPEMYKPIVKSKLIFIKNLYHKKSYSKNLKNQLKYLLKLYKTFKTPKYKKNKIIIYIKTSRNNTFLTSIKNYVLLKKNTIIKNLKKYKIKLKFSLKALKELKLKKNYLLNRKRKKLKSLKKNFNKKLFVKKNKKIKLKLKIYNKMKKIYRKFLKVSKVINWTSSGTAGFEKSKKSFPYAGEMAGIQLGLKLRKKFKKKNINIEIHIKGKGRKRRFEALKGLRLALGKKKKILKIIKVNHLPYNGCKLKKKRRV